MTHPTTYLRYLPAEAKIKSRQLITEAVAKEAVRRTIFPNRYAVTTEFEIGDTVTDIDGTKFTLKTDKEIELADAVNKLPYGMKDGKGWFKILAPISPAVTWEIEDGAEIEIEDNWLEMTDKVKEARLKIYGGIKVKGPCGHYH